MLQPDQQHPFPPVQGLAKGFCLTQCHLHIELRGYFPVFQALAETVLQDAGDVGHPDKSMDFGSVCDSLGGFIQTSVSFQLLVDPGPLIAPEPHQAVAQAHHYGPAGVVHICSHISARFHSVQRGIIHFLKFQSPWQDSQAPLSSKRAIGVV